MAVVIKTSDPAGLLKLIKKAIDDKEVLTWEYNSDGKFTHVTKSEQWKDKAWLSPKIEENSLRFNVTSQSEEKLSWAVYGVYHGRFIEMLVTHFHSNLTEASAVLPTKK